MHPEIIFKFLYWSQKIKPKKVCLQLGVLQIFEWPGLVQHDTIFQIEYFVLTQFEFTYSEMQLIIARAKCLWKPDIIRAVVYNCWSKMPPILSAIKKFNVTGNSLPIHAFAYHYSSVSIWIYLT